MADLNNGLIRELTSADYTANNAPTILKNVSPLLFKTVQYDLLQSVNNLLWPMFLVDKVEFGTGYRIVGNGLGKVSTFTTNPDERYPKTRMLLPDFEQVIVDKAQLKIRITYNQAETSFYFKDLQSLNSFIELTKKRLVDTLMLVQQDAILRIFADPNWKIRNMDDASEFEVLVDKIRNGIKNNIKAKSSNIKDFVQWLMLFIQQVTTITTAGFNIGWDRQDKDFIKQYNNVRLDDLVLIMSADDYIKFNTEIQAQVYNNKYFQFPNITIQTLPIPSGTVYLLDKKAIQFAPNRSLTYTDFFSNTLDTDIVHHDWFYAGIFNNAFGVKIDFVSDGKTVADYLVLDTNIAGLTANIPARKK